MNIVAVCGLGVGSSLILKMTIQKAAENLNLNAKVEHWDAGTVRSKSPDLIITTNQFKDKFMDLDNVIFVDNIVDEDEIQSKLSNYLDGGNL